MFERETELSCIEWFVAAAADGPVALVLEGAMGIGKTLLFDQARREAASQGYAVLGTMPRPADADLPFLGLTELLGPVAGRFVPELSRPLASALESVLLLAPPSGVPTERRSVFTAAVRGLDLLATEQPVILAIDDVQWLDADTVEVLRFAISRVQGPTSVLLAQRTESDAEAAMPLDLDRALPSDRVRRMRVGPLPKQALRRLLYSRPELAAARQETSLICQTSGGNPFYALELARMIATGQLQVRPGEPLPLPGGARAVVRQRLADLPDEARAPLVAAALMARPTVPAIAAATQRPASTWVDKAVAAGLIAVEQGQVAFTHPLLAAGLVDLALPEETRELHRQIACLVSDPEEHAIHLARSSYPPDSLVASKLADSARLAENRGALLAAADRYHQAAEFTPAAEEAARIRRVILAAQAYRDAGSGSRAASIVTLALPDVPEGPDRARLLLALAGTEAVPSPGILLDQALAQAGSDDALRAAIQSFAAELDWVTGDLPAASARARAAARFAATAGDAAAELRALGLAGAAATVLAAPDAMDLLRQAQAVEPSDGQLSPWYSPAHWLAVRALWQDDLDTAISGLEREYQRAADRGNEFDQSGLCFHLTQAHCRAGNLATASRYADLGYQLAVQFGSAQNLGVSCSGKALADASMGLAEQARAVAAEGLRAARSANDHFFETHLRSAVTFLEVSLGDYAAAAEVSAGLPESVAHMGIGEPGIFPFIPDRIESLIAVGQLGEAEALTREWEARGRELSRPRLLATGGRCRALAHAATGDLAAAHAAAAAAIAEHSRFTAPLELGRTSLVLGQVLRRLKKKAAAREALRQARSIFSEKGAPLWVAKTDIELSRIGGRASAPDSLTPTERELAMTVAAGATNREAADKLFLATSTVEAALSRIYRKLGVRSRTELARLINDQRDDD